VREEHIHLPEESLIANLHESPQILAGIQEKIVPLHTAHCGGQSSLSQDCAGALAPKLIQLATGHAACADETARFNFCKSTAMKVERITSAPSRALAPVRTPTKRRKSVQSPLRVAIQR
jgi:hypothetical protein